MEHESAERVVDPEWEQKIIGAVEENIDNIELFDGVVNFSPTALDIDDDRDFSDLTEQEQRVILKAIDDKVGFVPEREAVTIYESDYYPKGSKEPDPDQHIEVNVFPTGDENLFLHESRLKGKLIDVVLAPKDHRI